MKWPKRKRYRFQQVAALGGEAPTLIGDETPSTFMAAVSVSGSIVIVWTGFALAYNWDFKTVLPAATVPWFIYGVGRIVYLITILIGDITSLFDNDTEIQPRRNDLLPIVVKEDE